jgi:hypothetical protein
MEGLQNRFPGPFSRNRFAMNGLSEGQGYQIALLL